jgi:transcription elongation factor GreA
VTPPSTGLRFGQSVTVRDLASGETKRWKIDAAIGEEKRAGALAAQSPIARALLGHHAGDTVTVGLPRGTRQLLIEQIEDSSS